MQRHLLLGLRALLLLAAACLATAARADNWPRFRGPNGTGVAADKDVPVEWSDKKNLLWKTPLPGAGASSPVVWGDRLFVQSAEDTERILLCVNVADGKVLWKKSVPGGGTKTLHKKNTMASSTPATDGERVYALFWDGKALLLNAYDFKGELTWEKPLGPYSGEHGAGISPMVVDGMVILANDQTAPEGESVVVALSAKDGKTLWEKKRKTFRACYSTPFVLESGDRRELVVASTAGVTAYDLKDGKGGEVVWDWKWVFPGNNLRTVASPLFTGGLVIAQSGDGSGERHTVALKVDGSAAGALDKSAVVWDTKQDMPYVPCLLASGEHLYSVNDKGSAFCYVAATGKEVWHQRLGAGDVSASPVLIDGKVYAINEAGDAFVFEARPAGYKLLGQSAVGEGVKATPAVADNKLFIRGDKSLFCIAKAPK
jgi:outer membrane protein assembly factor BamB